MAFESALVDCCGFLCSSTGTASEAIPGVVFDINFEVVVVGAAMPGVAALECVGSCALEFGEVYGCAYWDESFASFV